MNSFDLVAAYIAGRKRHRRTLHDLPRGVCDRPFGRQELHRLDLLLGLLVLDEGL